MDSLKTVSKYEAVSKGTLEWEIQDVSLHFRSCHYHRKGSIRSLGMSSPVMQLGAGGGHHSKWHFSFQSVLDIYETNNFYLHFDGLLETGGSRINEPVIFKYNGVIQKLTSSTTEIMQTFDGSEFMENTQYREIPVASVRIDKFKKESPHGNLKISVEISHLSDVVNEVLDVAHEQFLDLLNLKDALPVPVPSCYGTLLNNSDMSDFKINCQGSTFQAHKLILSVRSRVFRAMIESGLSESTRNELKIQDVTVKTAELMLEFIYKGTVEIFPEDLKTRIQLLDCTEKYELDGLKSICMRKIFSSLPTEKEVGELAMAAFTYGANERASKVIKDFCTMNHAKLIQNPEYKKLFLANPRAFMN